MTKHPVIHLLHDAGLAAWTGGSLMGAIGLNGAAASLDDPRDRARASTAGWTRWAPVNAAAIGAHLIGASGLTITDWQRVRKQQGVAQSSAVKAAITTVGLGVAAWSAVLNRKMVAAGPVAVEGATEAGPATPTDVAKTLKQLQLVQWLNPLMGMALLGATAVHEEQMRTSQQVKGRLATLASGRALPLAAAAAGTAVVAIRRRRSTAGQATVATPPVVTMFSEPGYAAPVAVVDLTDQRTPAGTPAGGTVAFPR